MIRFIMQMLENRNEKRFPLNSLCYIKVPSRYSWEDPFRYKGNIVGYKGNKLLIQSFKNKQLRLRPANQVTLITGTTGEEV